MSLAQDGSAVSDILVSFLYIRRKRVCLTHLVNGGSSDFSVALIFDENSVII